MSITAAAFDTSCRDFFSSTNSINELPAATSSRVAGRVIAKLCGASFLAASAATNVRYAIGKSGDPIDQTLAAVLAAAVAVGLALAMPALLSALRRRRPGAALVALAATALFGTYSVTAALGSLGGHRIDAATTSQDATGARSRVQAAYSRAETDLAAVAPARAASEIGPEITAAMTRYRVEGTCDDWQKSVKVRTACIEIITPLRGELARAQRRAELQQRLTELAIELKPTKATAANADAATLASIGKALGINIAVDRVNLMLTVLAVAVLEIGAGLCFAIGEGNHDVASGRSRAAVTIEPEPASVPLSSPEPLQVASATCEGFCDSRSEGSATVASVATVVATVAPTIVGCSNNTSEGRDTTGDGIEVFISDVLVRRRGAAVRAGELHRAYAEWAAVEGRAPASLTMFGRRVQELGLRRETSSNRVRYTGIALRAAA